MGDKAHLFQCLLGLQCRDFVMLAADQMNTQSVIICKNDEEKIFEMSNRLLIGLNGEMGSASQFVQFVIKNLELYKMRNKYELSAAAATHFTRVTMADALAMRTPYMLNMLIGGYDDAGGCQLYSLDWLASCIKVPFASHGIGGILTMSIFDTYYSPDLSETQAYEVMKMCIHVIHERLFLKLPNFSVKVVSKDGVKCLPSITPATFYQ